MGTVLWLSIIWIAPLVCFLLANEAKFKKNIVVGVTLPYAARSDESVLALLKKFRSSQWVTCLILVALAAASWVLVPESMTIWMIWIDLCIVLPYVPYVRTNGALKKLKTERGWGAAASAQKVRVNTAAISSETWFSAWVFLPAVLLSLLPLAFERSMWAMNVTVAVCNGLFWFGYRYAYRNKSEMVDDNVEVTRVLTHVRRRNWGRMWLLCAYSMALLTIAIPLTVNSPLWSTILYIVFLVVIVTASLWVELSTRRVQEKLTAGSGQDWYVDEDDHWIGGLLYYNTNDSRLVINNRVGINSSINVAHPVGKILTILLVVMLLAMPLAGKFVGGGDVVLTADGNAVVGSNGWTEYVIALDEVESVQLMEELPENLARNFGTAMPTLLKGDFRAAAMGHMKVCLDPTVPPFVLLETTGGDKYLLGSRTEGIAESVYEVIS